MGYTNDGVDDFEKLRRAWEGLTGKLASFDDLLAALGLAEMPQAQRYGVMFGCLVFLFTISAVIALLVLGGSFQRIREQAETGESTVLSAHDARAQRALLLENLLESRERMKSSYPNQQTTETTTNLTKMLLNQAPDSLVESVTDLVDEKSTEKEKLRRYIPPLYEQNYVHAYRTCQDRPGGTMLSGRPEARFEAYARGYAGCGPHTSKTYRRSYARIYEAICCANHAADEKYLKLFKERPYDIIGRFIRLEELQTDRHLSDLFQLTSGRPALDHKAYDPQEVWSFQEDGPFADEKEMRKSFIFQRKNNEAAFAIVHSITNRFVGAILLTSDDPKNLTIQMESPIIPPYYEGSPEQLESCFLLMDRLFGHGYRRIQLSIDSQDVVKRKLATRLGFTLEGVLYKHMIVKESNRDSNIYSMLNSDWNKGARAALFKKLHGSAALRFDASNETKEAELDEQARVLAEKKQIEADISLKKGV